MSTPTAGRPPGKRMTQRKAPQRLRIGKTDQANEQLARQTRKLLGKHWANKYRHGRG